VGGFGRHGTPVITDGIDAHCTIQWLGDGRTGQGAMSRSAGVQGPRPQLSVNFLKSVTAAFANRGGNSPTGNFELSRGRDHRLTETRNVWTIDDGCFS